MKTKNTSFSIDQLGKQCGKLQYVRELTQNSIEAILDDKGSGEIFWTFDREEKKETGIHKLSIIDNGPGMTGEDLRSLMNNMYSSGKKQSIDGNFGIGAKVAGLYRSPKGMLYKSYRDGKGVLGEFIKNNVIAFTLWDLHCKNFLGQIAIRLGCLGLILTSKGHLVLVFAGNIEFRCNIFGGYSHFINTV